MSNFEVKIIADSIAPCGKRLTTLTATYPRFIHSEIMTHRDRARNAASSRAIPFPAMTERIEASPVIPLMWGMEQRGMQTGEEIPEPLRECAEHIWLEACRAALFKAKMLHNIGETYFQRTGDARFRDVKIHKSIPNRIVEPWIWITVVMTATEWANFFRLRCHPDAEIHFQKIAGMMRDALGESKPSPMSEGWWHLPFVDYEDQLILEDVYPNIDAKRTSSEEAWSAMRKVSVARCARVSYLTHEGKRDIAKDLELFDRLVQGSGFGHWSAHEHVAMATDDATLRSGPFVGWKQYRKSFKLENQEG